MEPFSKNPFESVGARIISSCEGNMMGVMGGAGELYWSDGELGIAVSGSRGQDSHGGEGLGEVASVGIRDGSRCAAPRLARENRG